MCTGGTIRPAKKNLEVSAFSMPECAQQAGSRQADNGFRQPGLTPGFHKRDGKRCRTLGSVSLESVQLKAEEGEGEWGGWGGV